MRTDSELYMLDGWVARPDYMKSQGENCEFDKIECYMRYRLENSPANEKADRIVVRVFNLLSEEAKSFEELLEYLVILKSDKGTL